VTGEPTPHEVFEQAYAAFDRGELREAARLFADLEELDPDYAAFPYMRGLAHKYLREWDASLRANLRSLSLRDEPDQASAWNAAIAATALGDWSQARTQWRACGIPVADGDAPVELDCGYSGLRLNPWAEGEVVFARRMDPARARIRSVPLPRSGHRFDDLVLHDGARQGERHLGDGIVPVFNALQLLERSSYETFAVFATCPTAADVEALQSIRAAGIGNVEDWTAGLHSICLRCSYGKPHAHTGVAPGAWNPERSLGIAAIDRAALDALLQAWRADGPGRAVDAIEGDAHAPGAPVEGVVWWDFQDDATGSDDAGDA
jgi:hypothetical protein